MKIPGISTARVKIVGVSPLLMHNARLANPADEIVRQIKAITKKHHTKKTESDELKLVELEFLGGLYEHPTDGVHIPAVNVEGAIRDGARISSQGKAVESGVQVSPERIPLIYDGPRTGGGLYKNKAFVDTRAIKLNKASTVMRTRPRFDAWSLEFDLSVVDGVLSRADVIGHLQKAGFLRGIGDYRPKFGRFVVESAEWMEE
jgi:hypothetical protein